MEEEAKRKPERTVFYTLVVFVYRIIATLFFFMRVQGRENIPSDGACILMSNHQCVLDPLTLALCVRGREIHFMGKKELFKSPVFGWIIRKLHAFPVDRGNMDMSAIRTAIGILKDGNTLGIFPEGTRSRTGHMLPLLGGASLLALRSPCQIVPIYIDGRYRIFHPITVRIGEPVPVDDLRAGRVNKDTCDELTRRMEAAFTALSNGKSLPEPEKN